MNAPGSLSVALWIALGWTSPIARSQSIELVSVADDGSQANDHCLDVAVSDDGNRIAFQSWATNLVAGDTNGVDDVFVRDRAAGTTIRVSVSSSGAEANDACFRPRISGDGNFVVFHSSATNLVANDLNHASDVFVHNLTSGTTTRASINSAGNSAGDRDSYDAAISYDGRLVAFTSLATNLVARDKNGTPDVFVRDRVANTTVRVSVATDGSEADGGSYSPAISRDGRWVTFTSGVTNFDPIDDDDHGDVYLHDLPVGTTTLIGVDSNGVKGDTGSGLASVSDDGRLVVFESFSSNLVAGDLNSAMDVFLRDVAAGTTICISVDPDGNPGDGPPPPSSIDAQISGDGRFVAFDSYADTLDDDDYNGLTDVFARETLAGVTTRCVRGTGGGDADRGSFFPRITADGTAIAFLSRSSNLIPGGVSNRFHAYVLDDRRIDHASFANYGIGVGGSHGVPTLTVSGPPVLRRDVDVLIGNSWGSWTVGLALLGTQRAQLPTSWGGDLLLVPTWTALVPLPPGGAVLSDQVPDDEWLVGSLVVIQVIELDPGAIDGVSFTAGLELVIGY